jgi:hypothetical protein
MKLLSFIKSLLPFFSKSQVLEDLRVTASELEQTVIPEYKNAADLFATIKLKSKANKTINDVYFRNISNTRGIRQNSIIDDIYRRLDLLKKNTEWLEEEVERILSKDVINEGLTARKANVIKAAEKISFISRFSTDLLLFIFQNEAVEEYGDRDSKPTPYEEKNIAANLPVFAHLISVYGIPPTDFVKIFGKIPEVEVNSMNEEAVDSLFKHQDLDPFGDTSFPVSNFTGNPIYHIRMSVAEWQTSRYKANKEKKKMLELRLLHLENLYKGNKDAAIEREIDYTKGRVDRLERSIKEVEESIGA